MRYRLRTLLILMAIGLAFAVFNVFVVYALYDGRHEVNRWIRENILF